MARINTEVSPNKGSSLFFIFFANLATLLMEGVDLYEEVFAGNSGDSVRSV